VRALVLLLLAGCGVESDPCDGKPAACVSVKAVGSFALDELDVTTRVLGGRRLMGQIAADFELPVKFALLLPGDTAGLIDVSLVGSLRHQPVAAGSGETAIVNGRGSLTIRMTAQTFDLAVAEMVLDSGTDLGASVDAAPTEPTLAPGGYAFPPTLVGQSASQTLTFSNPTAKDVVVSAIQVLPAGPPFSLDGGTCAAAKAVAPGQSCTVIVKFAPEQRGQVSVEARVSFGAGGEAGSFIDGWGVAWVAEGLEQDAGAVPTFQALWGTSLEDAWTGGDHATLFHRTQNGWTKVAPPAMATAVSGIWGTAVNDLWVASGLTREVDHTQNGLSWVPTVLASAGNVVTLWGQSDLYAATSAGEIWHLASNTWTPERSADNTNLLALWGSDDSDVWAVGGKILHRDVNGAWTALPAAGDHNAVWGAAADDVWVAGCDQTGTACGFVKHLENGTFSRVATPAAGALYGLWGGGQNDIFAVGKGGAILHYDGSAWTTEATPTSADLRAVWGAGGEVLAVGAGGTILHRY
jgi:hypothetical protein